MGITKEQYEKNNTKQLTPDFFNGYYKSQEDVSESKWQAGKIVIDGNDDEWAKPFNFFDNSSGVVFTVSNDSKNIYICFSNNDKAKTGKMMAAGWSLELSPPRKSESLM